MYSLVYSFVDYLSLSIRCNGIRRAKWESNFHFKWRLLREGETHFKKYSQVLETEKNNWVIWWSKLTDKIPTYYRSANYTENYHIILLFPASMTNFAQIDSELYLKINLFSLRKNYSNRRFCDACVIAVCSVIALITRKLRIQCWGPRERRTWVWEQVVHLLTGTAHIYHSIVRLWSVVNMWLWFDIYGPIWSTW